MGDYSTSHYCVYTYIKRVISGQLSENVPSQTDYRSVTTWDFLQTGRCNREFKALKSLFCPHMSCTIQMLSYACHQRYLPLSGSNSFGHKLPVFSFSRSLWKYLSLSYFCYYDQISSACSLLYFQLIFWSYHVHVFTDFHDCYNFLTFHHLFHKFSIYIVVQIKEKCYHYKTEWSLYFHTFRMQKVHERKHSIQTLSELLCFFILSFCPYLMLDAGHYISSCAVFLLSASFFTEYVIFTCMQK